MTEPVERKAYDREVTSACSSWGTALMRATSVTVSMPPRATPATPREKIVVQMGVEREEVATRAVARSIRSKIAMLRILYLPVLLVTIPASSDPAAVVMLNGIKDAPASVAERWRIRKNMTT